MHVALHRLRLLPRSTLLQLSDLPRGSSLPDVNFAHLFPRTWLLEREHMLQLHEPHNPLERVNARQFVSVHGCIFRFFCESDPHSISHPDAKNAGQFDRFAKLVPCAIDSFLTPIAQLCGFLRPHSFPA